MDKKQIIKIIKQNPQIDYTDLKKQTDQDNIPEVLLKEAWAEAKPSFGVNENRSLKILLLWVGIFFIINTILFFLSFKVLPKAIGPENTAFFYGIQKSLNAFVIVTLAYVLQYKGFNWLWSNLGFLIHFSLGILFSFLFSKFSRGPFGFSIFIFVLILFEWIYANIAYFISKRAMKLSKSKAEYLKSSIIFLILLFGITILGSSSPTSHSTSGGTYFRANFLLLLIGAPIALSFFIPISGYTLWLLYYFIFLGVIFYGKKWWATLLIILAHLALQAIIFLATAFSGI